MKKPPILRLYYTRRPIQWCNGCRRRLSTS